MSSKKHIAGIVPVSGIKSNFDMPWHESLMPLAPNYLAVERSILECAYAGCNTIWVVCSDDITPLIRYQVGEIIQDPVYNYRPYERNRQDIKRPIRIYYIPINIRDINKRDNLAWSAIHGAQVASKIMKSTSSHLAPDKFWISWPYGFYSPSSPRDLRRDVAEKDVMLSHDSKTIKDNLYLGLTLTPSQVQQLYEESRTRSTGLWKNPTERKQKYSTQDRFSYRNFNLKEVFETLDCSNYISKEVGDYYSLDNWQDYCHFLCNNTSLKRPKILKSAEWNEIGFDEEE